MAVTLRHVDVTPGTHLREWPAEALETLLDRGTITDWRALAAEIGASPWGTVARTVEQIANWREHGAVDRLMLAVIERARERVVRRGRERYAAEIRALRQSTGLSMRAFAALAGTSAARLSDYENGRTSPTTDVLARLEHAAGLAAAQD
jgi:DNA-binding transcriptional regulator YiaG